MKISLESLFRSESVEQGFTVEATPPESRKEEVSNTCNRCGRNFSEAILATNYSVEPAETYHACPYCLSKIELESLEPPQEEAWEPPAQTEEIEPMKPAEPPMEAAEPEPIEKEIKDKVEEEKRTEGEKPAPEGCPYHFGYLKEKGRDQPIPESCLTCSKMLECLL